MHVLKLSLLASAFLLSLLAPEARAQLVLPGKAPIPSPKGQGAGEIAPYYECLTCHQRNYQVNDDGRRDDQGNVIAWCVNCKHDRSQVLPAASSTRSGRGGRLVMPAPSTAPASNPASSNGANGSASGAASPTAAAAAVATSGAARTAPNAPRPGPADFVYTELSKQKHVDEALSMRAADSLLALGEDGITAARRRLGDVDLPVLLTSARVLLRSGRPEDADLVCQRMRGRLPVAAGTPLLDLIARTDPVRASPQFLAELLDHVHVGVRIEAEKRLLQYLSGPPNAKALAGLEPDAARHASLTGEEFVHLLEPSLASKRADTRQRALEILGRVEDPAATAPLLRHVADPSANVVAAVAEALAGRADPSVDAQLIGLAFRERWVLRTGACAILVIAEREDREPRPILDASNVESLLGGLQSGDPFIAGACAVGLSGIGFRSRDAAATAWLDQGVVDRLVATASGQTFHADLAALTPPALRRLELLTGQSFGSDGPRWIEWWLQSREGFFARRAWLEVRPQDVGRICVRYSEEGTQARELTLLGPENESSMEPPVSPGRAAFTETVRLDANQARDLVAALEHEGLLGPEKLPGLRGPRGSESRTLQILVGNRGKSFSFGVRASDPWFERTVALARELVDRNRWQRYRDPVRQLSTQELWTDQSAWWAEDHTETERALRMKLLVLAALPSRSGADRDAGIAEIERIYARPEGAEPADFQALLRLLGSEPYWAERTHRLLDLCLRSARAASAIGEEGTPAPAADFAREVAREVPVERGRVLVDLVVEKFPNAPAEELTRIFSACGSSLAQTMASDERVPIREAAASALFAQAAAAKSGATPGAVAEMSPETLAILMRLLGDPVPSVEVAAIQALGEHRIVSARTELIVRARLGVPEVRAAALRAIGRLRGEFVLDALSLGVADHDPAIRLAAAQGLAELADPGSVSLLIELLGDGESTPTAGPARAGLEALGPAAHEALLRVVHSQSHIGRREAALILARQCVPDVASALIGMLSTSPRDEHLASELCVLTANDLRAEKDPAGAWWSWWDGVVHDDATAWFLAGLARVGANPPSQTDLAGRGTRVGHLSMIEVLARREPHLVERARRELSRMLGRDVGSLPPRGEGRDTWIAQLRDSITSSETK